VLSCLGFGADGAWASTRETRIWVATGRTWTFPTIRPGGSELAACRRARGAAGAVLVACWSRPSCRGSSLHWARWQSVGTPAERSAVIVGGGPDHPTSLPALLARGGRVRVLLPGNRRRGGRLGTSALPGRSETASCGGCWPDQQMRGELTGRLTASLTGRLAGGCHGGGPRPVSGGATAALNDQ
jgi:hypothetical protein